MPTTDELTITSARMPLDGVSFWLGPLPRGELDESVLTGAWVPTTGAGWVDKTSTVLLSAGAEIAQDGRGYTISFTVADEARGVWADELPVAVVSTHQDLATATSLAAATVAFGYLDGSGRQALGVGLDQTGTRFVTLAGFWDRVNVPAHRLGRRNLATAGTITRASPALTHPEYELPVEYRAAPDDVAATKLIDGNADTVAVADVIASPTRPPIGDTTTPRLLRVFGSQTRGVAPGGQPRFVEVWAGHNETPWGTTWTSIPDMYNVAAGEGSPAIRTEAGKLKSEIVTYNPGAPDEFKAFRLTTYQNASPVADTWIMWIVSGANDPTRVTLELKAGNAYSIGKRVRLDIRAPGPFGSGPVVAPLYLNQDWATYTFNLGDTGGAKLAIKTWPGESAGDDLIYDLRNLRISTGWKGQRLYLCADDGLGNEQAVRINWDLVQTEDFRIDADSSVIFTDDIPTFRAMFDGGDRSVYQVRSFFPSWYFTAGIGRLKLAWAVSGMPPTVNDYDDVRLTTQDEIDFAVANGGVPWAATQALTRQTPTGTGSFAVEEFPHLGLYPGEYGAAHWQVALPAYTPPVLQLPLTGGVSTAVALDDPDQFPPAPGAGYIGATRFTYGGRDGETLTGCVGLPTAASGATVTPEIAGAKQTGWLIDQIEIRRKPGTPQILAGAVLTSNLIAPRDPADVGNVVGARWDRHPDWTPTQRWSERHGNPDVITIVPRDGVVQARHVDLSIGEMALAAGLPQRAKANELVVYQHVPGDSAGGWVGHRGGTIAAALGHLLTQHGGVPGAKVLTPGLAAPLGDLPLAPTTLRTAIEGLERGGLVRVWADPLGVVTVAPDPASPRYNADVAITFDTSNVIGEVQVTWATAHQVAQVVTTAREAATFRTYSISYPRQAGRLGKVVELKDVSVRSAQEAWEITEAAFRSGNARRRYRLTTGASRWARPYQRALVNFPDLDSSGQHVGVNCYVASFRHRLGIDEGGVSWLTDWELAELSL